MGQKRNYLGHTCVQELINTTHALQTKHNYSKNYKIIYGLREVEKVRLEKVVKRQYHIGSKDLEKSEKIYSTKLGWNCQQKKEPIKDHGY